MLNRIIYETLYGFKNKADVNWIFFQIQLPKIYKNSEEKHKYLSQSFNYLILLTMEINSCWKFCQNWYNKI